jgi:hypothetical protein
MDPNCTHCAEWELCPFHAKEKPAPEPAHDDEWVTCSDIPQTPWLKVRSFRGCAVPVQGTLRLLSDCGGYVRTYQDGKLVDEEPSEAYQLPSGTQLLVVTPRGIEPYRGWDIIDGSWVFWP